MPADQSPTVRRRRLGAELRRLREEAGLTAEQVGAELSCHASKIGRIENGRSGVRALDLREMFSLYRVTDQKTRDQLTGLAKESRKRGWWHVYNDVLSPTTAEFLSLEASASHIRSYEPLLVPGLLQTEDYVRGLMTGGRVGSPPDEIEKRVRLRMERQARFVAEDPQQLWAVIGEGALRKKIGGTEVMRGQLQRLLSACDQPNVTLQVLPFEVGAHPGVEGAFTALSFPEQDEQDVILIEAMTSTLYLETEQQVSRYKFAFNHIRAAALAPQQSQEVLERMLHDYST
ncbi:helix-turn-helix domain-containing protein [Kitasatospora sp. NBC_01302]|uniref:helix-turn-helix domain-containing protein n=1 Tax=Kitasatospora sp. NBC_01302 TaxID=2903575 RepID=UPI002E0DC948|nr:helix-turn-helix domain-containing protein [Kitasatospora sp. NBC_01302]